MSARKMIRSTWGVSALTLLSRILGLARDKALVLVFGAAPAVLDSFLLAFTIPNLFRRLFGEGALSGAFIPVFVDTRENRGPREADRLAGAVLTALTLLLGAATAAGILACLGGARLAGPDSEHGLALTLTAAMLPFMLFVCVAAILGGMLQSVRVFALPAAMPVALNLAFLAVLGYIHFHAPDTEPPQAACWVALAVVAAGAAQVALQWPALLARGVRVLPSFAFRQEGIGRILRAMGPTALGLAVFQVNVLADRLIAYLLIPGEGALTHLYLGNRLMQLPLALFGIALATTAFPDLVSHLSRKEYAPLFEKLSAAFRFLAFLMLPAAAGLIALGSPLVRMIFQEPDLAFSDAEVYRTALVLACYAPGLFFIGVQQLLTRVFYASGDYRTPVRITVWMVGLNLGLNLLLIHAPDPYLRYVASPRAAAPLREGGLALSTSVAAVATVWVMWRALRERLCTARTRAAWESAFEPLWGAFGRIGFAAAGTGVLAWLTARSIPYGPELWSRLERGLVPVLIGIGGYVLLCYTVPVPEIGEFLGRMSGGKRNGNADADGDSGTA